MAITEQYNGNLVFFWVSCKSNPPAEAKFRKKNQKELNFKCYCNVSVPVRVLKGVPFYLKAHASSESKFR